METEKTDMMELVGSLAVEMRGSRSLGYFFKKGTPQPIEKLNESVSEKKRRLKQGLRATSRCPVDYEIIRFVKLSKAKVLMDLQRLTESQVDITGLAPHVVVSLVLALVGEGLSVDAGEHYVTVKRAS